jgi:hypothetical protein
MLADPNRQCRGFDCAKVAIKGLAALNDRRTPVAASLAAVAFIFAFVCQASAGYFPKRPTSARLKTFSGVLNDYGVGNDIGGFTLIAGSSVMHLYIGQSMRINGKLVTCKDPDLMGMNAGPMGCADWPSWLVLGTSYVTAKCWQDRRYVPEASFWFCDELDKAATLGRRDPAGVLKSISRTPPHKE